MRLPDHHSSLNGRGPNSLLWDTLERIQKTLLLRDAEMAELLRLPTNRFTSLKERFGALSAFSIMALAERLDIKFEHLVEGRVEYPRLAAQYFGRSLPLPERYSVGAFSRRRTSINLLTFIEQFHGWRMRTRLLRNFSLTEADFAEPNELINLQFLTDACRFLKESEFDSRHFFAMGTYSFHTNRASPLAAALKKFRSPQALHEQITSDFVGKYYDQNFEYRVISLSRTSCQVEVLPHPKVQEALRRKDLGNFEVCELRSGTFASLAGYLGLPFSQVRKQSCIHQGEKSCRYWIDFGKGASTFRAAPTLQG